MIRINLIEKNVKYSYMTLDIGFQESITIKKKEFEINWRRYYKTFGL